MSWYLRLAPLVLMSACGGTTLTRSDDAGAGGTGPAGAGGAGAEETGGRSTGGAPPGNGGKVQEPTNHRPAEVPCGTRPSPGGSSADAGSPLGVETCAVDADCTHGVGGRCIFGRIGQYCTYDACFGDADCAQGAICMCSTAMSQGSHCSQPGCRVDADCPGSWCSPTFGSCGNYSGVVSYQCHTPKDECTNDTDCGAGTSGAPYCMYDPMVGHWHCSSSQCVG